MTHFKIIFLLILNTLIYANPLSIDNNTEFYNLLPHSKIFIDESKSLTIKEIEKKDHEFIQNDKMRLAFGYSPDFNVWVKFTIKNNTNRNIIKVLEYDNSLTSHIELYDPSNQTLQKEGLFQINEQRKAIHPIFKITLEANETKTYYLKASSYITTLIIKLNIWDNQKFYEKEIKHQLILALFFGAMMILMIYNLFIYFVTKDISYLFYVLYIVGIIAHHLIYVGIANVYLLNQTWIIYIIEFATALVAFPIFALALFTKSFLQTKQYPIYDKILNIFLVLIPISIVVFTSTDLFNKYRNLLSICLLLYLMIITIYATYRRNKQAYFILFGWIIFLTSGATMYLSSLGIVNVYTKFPYIIEIALVLEAVIFSIALANRINILQKDKEEANKKLITQQENENQRLEIKVLEKTNDLKVALDEKGLLLKELNHRVKNNMQTIVSLIRLQIDETQDDRLQDVLVTIQNRINAMSHLHELLYKQDNISHVNAYEYFELLIEEVKDSYNNHVNIIFDIKTELKMEQAIYCGLILNELISNSFKYAFPEGEGNINIYLNKENSNFNLSIKDDGIGYDKDILTDSLGLILVNTLAKQQLRGDINILSTNGVRVDINWSNHD